MEKLPSNDHIANLQNHPKTQEYIDRIKMGEDINLVLQGLPDSIRQAVNLSLEEKIETNPTDATAKDIKRFFESIRGGLSESIREKINEYVEKIEAGSEEAEVLRDLPPSFRNAIQSALLERRSQKDKADNLTKRIETLRQEIDQIPDENDEETTTKSNPEASELLAEIITAYGAGFRKHARNQGEVSANIDGGINPETGEFFPKVDSKIAMDFDAHGIAKLDQLDNLLRLLAKGIDPNRPFFSAPFDIPKELKAGLGAGLGTAGGTAYKDGVAVVTSGYKESLVENGIKHVFINDLYYQMIEPLKKLYPNYQFHLISEQKSVMESEAKNYSIGN